METSKNKVQACLSFAPNSWTMKQIGGDRIVKLLSSNPEKRLTPSDTTLEAKKDCHVLQHMLNNSTNHEDLGEIRIRIAKHTQISNTASVVIAGDAMEEIFQAFKNSFSVKFIATGGNNRRLETGEMCLIARGGMYEQLQKRAKIRAMCVIPNVPVSPNFFHPLTPGERQLDINIVIIFSKGSVCHQLSPEIGMMMNTMLNESINSDVTLLSKNRKPVKSHKSILSVRSPVFAASLRCQMEESSTGVIETELDDRSLEAFLQYLYTCEVFLPLREPQVALDLLQAGHKYQIETLESRMKAMLLDTPDDIWTVDEVIKLFFFAKNVKELENLAEKAIRMLISNKEHLQSSEEFQRLFRCCCKANSDDEACSCSVEGAKELLIAIISAVP